MHQTIHSQYLAAKWMNKITQESSLDANWSKPLDVRTQVYNLKPDEMDTHLIS